jgi:agmatine deiminase
VIWLNVTLEGDDTDGHIDNAARFVSADTVVCLDSSSVSGSALRHQLRTETTIDGRPLTVVSLPLPEAVIYKAQRLPASYANFLITNQKVLVPIYGGHSDETALATLQELFPRRHVVGIPARPLVVGYGSIHCLSMQVPLPQLTSSGLS